jgi:TPR repeat protein
LTANRQAASRNAEMGGLRTLSSAPWVALCNAEWSKTLAFKIASGLIAGLIVASAWTQATAGPLEDGENAVRRGDYSTALTQLLPLAEHGSAQAQYEVGRIYEGGRGVAKDYLKAANWYRRSALAGDHRAQLLLALMYARGQGVPQDDKEGVYWISGATEDDPPQKQRVAKMMYYEERGSFDHGRQLSISELTARALPALQQQADQGDPHAKCALLQLYETGQAVARKSDDVASLHRTCAQMRHEVAGAPLPAIPALPVPAPRPHD